MAMRAKLTMKGFEEFLERVQEMGRSVDDAADEMLKVGGDVLLAGMQQRAPKDTHNLVEHLERSEPVNDGNFHFVEVGLVKADAETARYATAQEFGWQSTHGHNAGTPYIRPTIDEDMPKARRAMREKLEEYIDGQ